MVVGGSWGSTRFSICTNLSQEYYWYGIRSVFLGTKNEIEWAFTNSAKLFRPDLWIHGII